MNTSDPHLLAGLDVLLADESRLRALRGRSVGLLAHASSVTATWVHAIDALVAADVPLAKLFGPEHGLRGEAQMMVAVDDQRDALSGLPVVSLYGCNEASLDPTTDALKGLDVVLIDVQDVGSRYYTYVATALKLARLATSLGVDVLVLDRPNPLGRAREGGTIAPGFHSFVGELAVPNRHGLSVAELFQWAANHGAVLRFDVVPVEGWNPRALLDEHQFTWALPSPNMPTVATALVYPGMCLLEATNISEGRGTTRPFELFGAPWIDAPALQRVLQDARLPGVGWRLASYRPTFDKFTDVICYGLQLHIQDASAFEPLRTAASILLAVARLHPADFGWRPGAYEFVEDIPAIDLLAGSTALRDLIEGTGTMADVMRWARTPPELDASCRAAERYDV